MSFEGAPEDYCARWPEYFRAEANAISDFNLNSVLNIEHVGSTAVAGLIAKPIIDILIVTKKNCMMDLTAPLKSLNYIAKGENGVAGRSYFSRPPIEDQLSVHVHAFEEGHPEISRHVAFRNYLRAFSNVKNKYAEVKRQILSGANISRNAYQDLRAAFIEQATGDALRWNANRKESEKVVKKALIYIFRNRSAAAEILVFDHLKFPELGPQIPSGTIDEHEDIFAGAHRELFEESGLTCEKLQLLGSYTYYKPHIDQFQERFIFVGSDLNLPKTWIHKVSGNGSDRDLEFRYRWIAESVAKKTLEAGLGDGLELFENDLAIFRR